MSIAEPRFDSRSVKRARGHVSSLVRTDDTTGGPTSDRDQMEQTLKLLLESGQVTELRALNVSTANNQKHHVVSGYFDDIEKLVDAAFNIEGASGIYVVPNPINPDLIARAANRVRPVYGAPTTSDKDIESRRWLLIDIDPLRPSGISSTDEEVDSALELALRMRENLGEEGWPAPILASSGNGIHLLYKIDLQVQDDGLVKGVLEALSCRFDNDRARVDTTVHNPARIWKLYGTLARKGDDVPDRPHRLARLIEFPDEPEIVPERVLHSLAERAPSNAPANGSHMRSTSAFDIDSWIKQHQLHVSQPAEWQGGRRWVFTDSCPWNSEHRDTSAYIVQFPSGAIAAGCHHAGCAGRTWADLRATVEGQTLVQSFKAAPSNHSESTAQQSDPNGWEAPTPFREIQVPDFPVDVLPEWLGSFVKEVSESSQTPLDLPGMLVLSACAAACGGSFKVKVRADSYEPLNLYSVVALPPGSRKSSVFTEVTQPIYEYESQLIHAETSRIADLSTQRRLLEGRLAQTEKLAAKANESEREELEKAVQDITSQLAQLEIPSSPLIVVDDITTERLISVLSEQNGRLSVLSSEGDLFEILSGRYSNGVPNIGAYLKAHDGGLLRVDRQHRAPDLIHDPALTIGLTVQPEVLRGLMTKPVLSGRGLLARFLYAVPPSPLGHRDPDPPQVSEWVLDRYDSNLTRLLDLGHGGTAQDRNATKILELDEDARDLLVTIRSQVESELIGPGSLATIPGWAGKLTGAIARLAGLIHLAEHVDHDSPWVMPISVVTMDRARTLGLEYLADHASAAFAVMGSDPIIESAKHILRWVDVNGAEAFSKRDLFNGLRGRFKSAPDMNAPLKLLEEHGYVHKLPADDRTGRPGRPKSAMYEVNPSVHSNPLESAYEGALVQGVGGPVVAPSASLLSN